jgi:chorismate mutase
MPTLAMVPRSCTCMLLMLYCTSGIPAQKVSDTDTRLASCRRQIDNTDQQIVALLNQRARIVAEVGKIKQEAHVPVTATAREKQVLDHVVQMGSAGPLPVEHLRRIYQAVIQEMRDWESEENGDSTDLPAKKSSDQQ